MPTIRRTDTVAANSRSGNVLSGELFEFIQRPSRVQLLSSAAATGITADFTVGGVQELAGAVIPLTNRDPIKPDDEVSLAAAVPGERMFLEYFNSTGAGIVVKTVIEILA